MTDIFQRIASGGFWLFLLSWASCKKAETDYKCYPDEVEEIIVNTCAVSGCHNESSYEAAGGLNLSSWETLFGGGNNSAAVIPYRADQSPLMFFINTDSTAGPVLKPTMPFERTPLSDEQVATIRNWIEQGAPNCEGFVKFSDNPDRKKIYVPNQGCDLVAVLDFESRLVMRYIDVGAAPQIESPHSLRLSPDGRYWFVCFTSGAVFQKFKTEDDSFAGEAAIGQGAWNTFAITSDSRHAFVVDFTADGAIAYVDLATMTMLNRYEGLLASPHGCALKDDNTLYVTAQFGNFIYKLDITNRDDPAVEMIPLQPGVAPSTVSKHDAHEIAFSPDKSEYLVTCQKTNEVRFFDAATDSLIAVVATGEFPQEIAYSASTDYVFISCPEDDATFPGVIGSVAVIDYRTHTLVKSVNVGFQPHGIAVDDASGLVLVANRNVNPNGPAPHHTSACGGRNGYLTIINMNTLELIPGYRAELSVDPYFVAVRD